MLRICLKEDEKSHKKTRCLRITINIQKQYKVAFYMGGDYFIPGGFVKLEYSYIKNI